MIEINWNGDRAAIGSGIFARDVPSGYDPADLAAYPGQRLQEFVRYAAMEVVSARYFAGAALPSDPRWKHGPIRTSGINA